MRKIFIPFLFALACFNLCSAEEEPPRVFRAKAVIKPTFSQRVRGVVTFEQVNGGIKIIADIENLKPGLHGFHVHTHSDCGSDGSSAGGIFNPTWGYYNPSFAIHGSPDNTMRYVGDLGNVSANSKGVAHYERIDKVIQLNGPLSVIGHSIVVHKNADDFVTQPTGGSGVALGCGVIEAVNP